MGEYKIFVYFLLMVIAPIIHASTPLITTTSVPFQNIILNPNNVIRASYNFGASAQIFCFENNLQSVGLVTWTYRGTKYSSTLSLYLITNGNYQGSFADPTGVITVTNTTVTPLVVSCLFAF